jgi:prevent-host-death family protein
MRSVTAREANHQFSSLLTAVEQGETVTITKHGRPVAVLQPYRSPQMTPERKRLLEEAFAIIDEPLPWEGEHDPNFRAPTRDEIYER